MANNERTPPNEPHTSNAAGDARSGPDTQAVTESDAQTGAQTDRDTAPREIGGRKGPDPARYGDWEKQGRCIDF